MADWYMATRLARREKAWAEASTEERVALAKEMYNALVATEESLTVYPTSTSGKMIEDVAAVETAKRLAREIATADLNAYLEAHAGEDMAEYLQYLTREYPEIHPFMGELLANWEKYLPAQWYPMMGEDTGISLAKCLGMDWTELEEVREPLDEVWDWQDSEDVEYRLAEQVEWDPRTDPWIKRNEATFQEWILLILDSWMRWKVSYDPPNVSLEDLLWYQNNPPFSLREATFEELMAPPTSEDLPLIHLAWKYRPEGKWWMDALETCLGYLSDSDAKWDLEVPYTFPAWVDTLCEIKPWWKGWTEYFQESLITER